MRRLGFGLALSSLALAVACDTSITSPSHPESSRPSLDTSTGCDSAQTAADSTARGCRTPVIPWY